MNIKKKNIKSIKNPQISIKLYKAIKKFQDEKQKKIDKGIKTKKFKYTFPQASEDFYDELMQHKAGETKKIEKLRQEFEKMITNL